MIDKAWSSSSGSAVTSTIPGAAYALDSIPGVCGSRPSAYRPRTNLWIVIHLHPAPVDNGSRLEPAETDAREGLSKRALVAYKGLQGKSESSIMSARQDGLTRSRYRPNRAILARHASTHAAITHPRREVVPQACLGQRFDKSTLGHLPCRARHGAHPGGRRVTCRPARPVRADAPHTHRRPRYFGGVRCMWGVSSSQGARQTTGERSAPRLTASAQRMIQAPTPRIVPSAYAVSPS